MLLRRCADLLIFEAFIREAFLCQCHLASFWCTNFFKERWVAKLGRWVTNFCSTPACYSSFLGLNPDISQKYKMGDINIEVANTLYPSKKYTKKMFLLEPMGGGGGAAWASFTMNTLRIHVYVRESIVLDFSFQGFSWFLWTHYWFVMYTEETSSTVTHIYIQTKHTSWSPLSPTLHHLIHAQSRNRNNFGGFFLLFSVALDYNSRKEVYSV